MVNNAKVTSYVCLSFGFLFYLLAGAMRLFGSAQDDEQKGSRQKYSRWLFTLSAIFIAIATFAGAGGKSLDSKDYLNIIIVVLSLVLIFMASWGHYGLFSITLATTIAIFSSVQLVLIN